MNTTTRPETITVTELLTIADHVLTDPGSPEALLDRIVADICRVEIDAAVDHALLQRVIAALAARRSAVGAELADLARQRAELAHRHRGVAGYTRSGGSTRDR